MKTALMLKAIKAQVNKMTDAEFEKFIFDVEVFIDKLRKERSK